MPIYAYRCEACGFAKDILQKISDAPLTDCESCGKPAMKKQVTAAGFQLKGSGWYVTDFRNNGNGTNSGSAGADKSRADSADSSGSTSADSSAGAASSTTAATTAATTASSSASDSKPAAPAAA
jgi:putative FmdB family regulatory protein